MCQNDDMLFVNMTRYREREMARAVEAGLKAMPAVVVTGMRQVGKSTMLTRHRALGKRRYLTLDDIGTLEDARRDPDAFVHSAVPLTIDEAQRAPELLMAIKRAVDRRRRNGWFLLSGSANFSLLRSAGESLAGRAIYMEMHPFTRREIAGSVSGRPFLQRMYESGRPVAVAHGRIGARDVVRGGMPTPVLSRRGGHGIWYRGFVQTYVERDVRNLSQVADLVSFQRLMRLAALRTGQVLEIGGLARDAQLSVPTASRHLGILEASYITRTVKPYLSNRASRLVKSPKFYFTDSGLAGHLWGAGSEAELRKDPRFGALVETYAAQNISAILSARWPEASLCFWGVQGRHEVDFVIDAGKGCLAIEVKSVQRWRNRDVSGLAAFLDATPHCRAGVLAYDGSEVRQLGRRLWAVPMGVVLG